MVSYNWWWDHTLILAHIDTASILQATYYAAKAWYMPPILLYVANISLDLCRMPNLWKIGEIIPVNKKPLPKVDNDLRPVTLTAILAKCFERVILPKISSHTKPIMDKLQFAYLPNRSTDDATTTLIHELSQHLDRKSKSKYARCLFIDYS